MADLTESLLQDCTKCGALMDVTEEEPFALMHCPTCGAAVRVRTQFGNFELQELLGAGGMGSVYRAMDTNLHRQVALKLLRQEYSAKPEFNAQFAHEAAITAQINHPNVVKVYSSGCDHGLFYIAMELVDKGSLDDLISLEGTVSEMHVLEVGIQVAKGLDAAYQRGLIHRDVKPGNILFADGHTAKIVDFGLAVPMDQAGTIDGEIWGTPYYVAPEKLDDRPEDFRSDMYSLAASLFHALAGKPPHDADDASISSLRELKSKPVNLQSFAPGISSATAYVIDRAMHMDPDQRYPSYAEFVESLEYAQSELRKKKKETENKPLRPPKKPQIHSGRWTLLGLGLGILVGSAALFPIRDQILGNKEPVSDPTTELALKAASDAQAEYQSARQLLISGEHGAATEAFRKIADQENNPEPLRSWARFHSALAATIAGDSSAAASDWNKLVEKGPFSKAAEDQKLATFFLETAQKATSQEPIPVTVARDYSGANYEALAVLAFGAKNWASGEFDSAEGLFTAFRAASPERGNAWIGEYKPIAEAYLADLAVYRSMVAQDQAAPNPAQSKALLASLKDAQGKIKLKGALADAAASKIQDVEARVASYESEQARLMAEAEEKDAATLSAAQANANPLALQYRFDEARAVVATAPVITEKGKRDKATLLRRTEWLTQFKSLLVRDLAAAGYQAPVRKKVGGELPGVVSRATETRVELKSQYGSVPVPWPDLAYESVFQMARSFIRPDSPPERQLERKWLLGVYALFAGKAQEGRALLGEAAQSNVAYRELLPLFPELDATM